jgi:hypothetical protein
LTVNAVIRLENLRQPARSRLATEMRRLSHERAERVERMHAAERQTVTQLAEHILRGADSTLDDQLTLALYM